MFLLNENLRKLRKEKGLTQEQLANHLSVSPQAISRWENGTNCPDVMMLPIIANYYNITTDELLGVDITKNQKRIEILIYEAQQLQYAKKRKEAVELLEKGLSQFPNNFKIMSSLIVRLLDLADELYDDGYNSEILSKVLEYGDRIIAECMDDEIRQTTIAYLAGAYNRIGDVDGAKRMVMKLSNLSISREIQIQNLNLNDQQGTQKIIWELSLHLYHAFEVLSDINYSNPQTKYSFDERIELLKKMLSIFEILFENKDYGYFFSCVSQIYRQLGACYANKKDKENTLYYLTCSFELIKNYEAQKRDLEYSHTSIAFNELKYKQSEFVIRGSYDNECELFVEKLKHSRYDFIRDDESFKTIIENANN